jgi:MT-A70
MVWRKMTINGKGTGNKLPGRPRGNCEFVLCGRRGSPRFIDTTAFDCCFDGVAREHSRKPDEFYELIKRVTEGRRIDVFSRGPHEGWEACGNELDRFPETVLPTGKFKLTLEELGLLDEMENKSSLTVEGPDKDAAAVDTEVGKG